MRVSEIFYSIQGEGRLAGVPSWFIRLAGCDLRCRWCDTPYALSARQGREMSVGEIFAQIEKISCGHTVVTGGEPLLAEELPELLDVLKQNDMHITLETSATRYRKITCDLVSISPKLAGSTSDSGAHAEQGGGDEGQRLNVGAIQQFIDLYDYQLKFVIEQEGELAEIDDIMGRLKNVDREKVMLMPQSRTRQEYRKVGPQIAQLCIKHGFRYCPRLHIELWGNRRKK